MNGNNEKFLLYLLRHTKAVLEKHNVDYWLECGTLLGAVRDERFILWEHDIDIGTWSRDVTPEKKQAIKKEFSKRGFKVHIFNSHMNIRKDRYCADINFYFLNANKAIVTLTTPVQLLGKLLGLFYESLILPHHYKIHFKTNPHRSTLSVFLIVSRMLPSKLREKIAKAVLIISKKMLLKDVSWVVPVDFLSSFSNIVFYGMEFRVPTRTEEYLAERYGKDWMIPRKDWITERDDKCVVKRK